MPKISNDKIRNDVIRICELLQRFSTECVEGLKRAEDDVDVAVYLHKIWGAVEEVHPALTVLCRDYRESL